MHAKTAVDALVDAGTSVARAVSSSVRDDGIEDGAVTGGRGNGSRSERGSGAGRNGEPDGGDAKTSAGAHGQGVFGTFVVGTLLALSAARVPVLWILLVGYVVRSAREHTVALSGFGDWRRLAAAGVRATAVIAALSLPAAAVLTAVGPVEWPSAPLGTGGGVELGALVVAAGVTALGWHCSVAAVLALAWADGRPETPFAAGVRFVRSPATRRVSLAVGGAAVVVAFVRFGVGALPAVGPLLAAAATFFGVAVAARLLGERVAARTLRADRLATTGRAAASRSEHRKRRRANLTESGHRGTGDGAEEGAINQPGLRA